MSTRKTSDLWSPAQRLIVDVLKKAVRDWQKPTRDAKRLARRLGFESLEEELLEFFSDGECGKWLEWLECGHLDLLGLLEKRSERE